MFDFLKKKITNFVSSITGKKEEQEETEEKVGEKIAEEKKEGQPEIQAQQVQKVEPPQPAQTPQIQPQAPQPEQLSQPQAVKQTIKKERKTEEKKEQKPSIKPSLSVTTILKSVITGEVEIKESDVAAMLDSLELELIEADVGIEIASSITNELRNRLIGKKVARNKLNEFVKEQIREVLHEAMTTGSEFSILERIKKSEKPFKIVFLGINGSGKTTTIAKIAALLKQNGLNVVLAAADTFRAAAIEQLEAHSNKLGVKMIKKEYGSDPTSVAFDAINYAKAHNIDVILIDTAGRQETNVNLMNELKKINRVIKPDLKIYVGESIGGNALLEQVKMFNTEIGIDGIILTKLDCDAKGGTVISAARATNSPILMIGTGQKYEDIEEFEPKKIIDRLLD